jgi:hypothetical protein
LLESPLRRKMKTTKISPTMKTTTMLVPSPELVELPAMAIPNALVSSADVLEALTEAIPKLACAKLARNVVVVKLLSQTLS